MNYKRIREHPSRSFKEKCQPPNKKSRIDNEEFLSFSNPPDNIFNEIKIPRKTNNEISSNENTPLVSDIVSPILPPFPQAAENMRRTGVSVTKTATADNPDLGILEKSGTTIPKQLKYYRCEQCNIFLSSQVTLDAHLAGARHTKKLKELELSNGSTDHLKKDKVRKLNENEFLCTLCKVSAKSLLQIKSHIDGSKHKKNMQIYCVKKKNKSETIEELPKSNDRITALHTPIDKKICSPVAEPTAKLCNSDNKSTTVEIGSKQSFLCKICALCMNSQLQYDQHVNSKKHSAKVSKLCDSKTIKIE